MDAQSLRQLLAYELWVAAALAAALALASSAGCASPTLPPAASPPAPLEPPPFTCEYAPTEELPEPVECPAYGQCDTTGTLLPAPLDDYLIDRLHQCLEYGRRLAADLTLQRSEWSGSLAAEQDRSQAIYERLHDATAYPPWFWAALGAAGGVVGALAVWGAVQ